MISLMIVPSSGRPYCIAPLYLESADGSNTMHDLIELYETMGNSHDLAQKRVA
jgi:hypothetical protein